MSKDTVKAKALHTVIYKDQETGAQTTKTPADKPFSLTKVQFDEFEAMSAVRRAKKSDSDDADDDFEEEVAPSTAPAVVVGNQGDGDSLQVQNTQVENPQATTRVVDGPAGTVATPVEIPADWTELHWQKRVKLAEAISGKEVTAQGETTAADVANGIISAELSRRASQPNTAGDDLLS